MTNHEISKEWIKAFGYLNEPQKRWFAAVKAKELGYGGVSQVSRATGLSRTTVTQGLRDLEEDGSLSLDSDRLRREGGGRKYSRHKSPELLKAIEGILEESSAGDLMSRLRWTCKSTRSIADQLLACPQIPLSLLSIAFGSGGDTLEKSAIPMQLRFLCVPMAEGAMGVELGHGSFTYKN